MTGTWNTAPADARTTLGLNTSTVPSSTTTRAAPAASATRRIVPRLPGSPTPAATTAQPVTARERHVAPASDRQHGLRRHGRGDPLEHARSQLAHRHAGGQVERGRDLDERPGLDEHALELDTAGHRLGDAARVPR